MKKLVAASAIALSLFACKKNATADNKNDNQSKTEIAGASANGENNAGEAKNLPAISDSAGVYTLQYKLEKGKTYPFVMVQKNVDNISMGDKNQAQTNQTTDNISFTVNDFQNGIYDFEVKFNSKKQVGTDAQGKKLIVDTDGAAPQEEQLKMLWKMNKALMGHPLKLKMKEDGTILSVTGFDPVYKKISGELTSTIKEKKEREQVLEGLKQGFSEKALKEQFKTNLSFFPTKGMKIGEKFSETENLDPEGKLKSSTTFTLAKVDDEFAHFNITGGIPKKSEKQSKDGITSTVSFSGTQSGTIKINKATGWMGTSNVTMRTSQTQTLTDGKQSETAKQSSVATTTINP